MTTSSKFTKASVWEGVIWLTTLSLSLLLTVVTVQAIVFLALKYEGSSLPNRFQELTLVSLPSETPTEVRKRSKPKPIRKPDSKPVFAKPIDVGTTKPTQLKSIPLANFKPNLGIVGDFRVNSGSFISSGPTRGLIPVYQSPPQYPYKAQQRGLEGMVELEFTITTTGTVTDIKVIQADPPNVFNRAAMQAIARWRFKPKEENGVPIKQRAIKQIRFQLNSRRR